MATDVWGQPIPDDGSNLPDWMKNAIGNVGNIGPGAASYVSSSGPQDFSKLLSMFQQSLGMAPTMVDEGRLKSLFQDQIAAAMQLGGEQINSAEGERGAAVRPGGVATQKMMDLGLKVQEPMMQALVSNLFGDVTNKNSQLASLFGAASGNQSNSLGYRNTTQDINSQLPPYVQQSNPAAGGQGGTGGGGGGGGSNPTQAGSKGGFGGGGSTPWWQTSYGDMNQGKGQEWNDAHPGSLAGFNPGTTNYNLNTDAGETPTGGGGHGLQNLADAGITEDYDPDEIGWIAVEGPHESYYGTRAAAEANTARGYKSTWSPR